MYTHTHTHTHTCAVTKTERHPWCGSYPHRLGKGEYLCKSISTCIHLYTFKRKYTSVRYGMETRALVSGQFLDR